MLYVMQREWWLDPFA